MPNPQQNQESDFMIEKIKERPVNKKKLLRRTLTTASMAVIFGLIACLTFLILEPVFNHWLYPEEKPKNVELPEEIEEIRPEDMLVEDEPEADADKQEVTLQDDQIKKILSGIEWSVEDYRALYASLSSFTGEISRSVVTITGAVSNVDWFNESYESEGATSGVLFYNNGRELLILADHTLIAQADTLTATFYDGTEVPATVKQYDSNTNLAVCAVSISDLTDAFLKQVVVANLGTSNLRNLPGTPVVVVGSPMGVSGSVSYGIITSANTTLYMADANYKLLQTNIFGSQNASGVLFDLQGRVLGIVTNGKNPSDMKNLIAAYGISELKKPISRMGNGKSVPYLGIVGTDVTKEANEELNVPYGAYIKEVYMDSPAMLAGIQRGDVIVEINEATITHFSDFSGAMQVLSSGSTVSMKIMRPVQNDYKEMTFEVTLEEAH